jgi:ATP-dependent RNA helicase RhlE
VTDSQFAAFGFAGPLLSTIARAGYTEPTPIQTAAIPPQMAGRDVMGIAKTGSGKTAAYVLPMLHWIAQQPGRPRPRTARGLILAPTRELAVQIQKTLRDLTGAARVTSALVLGGVSRFSQIRSMSHGVDVLIATPGRLIDLMQEGAISLGDTHWLVLDEADRMLDMGFIRPVMRIAQATARDRLTALFSATMAPEVAELCKDLLHNPVRVEVEPQGSTAVEIDQGVLHLPAAAKRYALRDLLADETVVTSVMVFTRTKRGADKVAANLQDDGLEAEAIHGNKSQNARQRALEGFRSGAVRILVATDIAARGIDVPGISHVINYDLPDEPENYVHRIGRTGRAGRSGIALTLCDPSERAKLSAIEKLTRKRIPVATPDDLGLDLRNLPTREPQRDSGRDEARGGDREDRRTESRSGGRDDHRNASRSGHRTGGRDRSASAAPASSGPRPIASTTPHAQQAPTRTAAPDERRPSAQADDRRPPRRRVRSAA